MGLSWVNTVLTVIYFYEIIKKKFSSWNGTVQFHWTVKYNLQTLAMYIVVALLKLNNEIKQDSNYNTWVKLNSTVLFQKVNKLNDILHVNYPAIGQYSSIGSGIFGSLDPCLYLCSI